MICSAFVPKISWWAKRKSETLPYNSLAYPIQYKDRQKQSPKGVL